MEDDWDLQAVVRGCTTAATTTTTTTTVPNTCCGGGGDDLRFLLESHEECEFFEDDADLFSRDGRSGIDDLHELYKPFCSNKPFIPNSVVPISPLSVLQDLSQMQMKLKQQQQLLLKPKHNLSMAVPSTTKDISNVNSRSKRRKTQLKKVIEIAAEALSSDMWSWRKYGQKPIKGSPYPRGYYKCSTSKECLARKQVERNRSDPGIFIVTYTAEHNHPMPTHKNSLAGISRQKPPTTTSSDGGGEPSSSSPPVSPSEQQAVDKYLETESRCKDQILEDVNLEDDFFEGLEEFEDVSPVTGEIRR